MKHLLSLIAVFAFINTSHASFTDVSSDYTYSEALEKLVDDGVITGYEDKTYKPNNRINRAEFLTLLMRASGYELEGGNCFPDVKNEWFAPSICTAADMGFVDGYSDGFFRPEQYINFAEASKIVANVLEQTTTRSLAREWFEPFVNALEESSAIPLSVQSADQFLNRGELAEMVWRIREEVTTKPTQDYNILTTDLPSFDSCAAMQETLEQNKFAGGGIYYGGDIAMPMVGRGMEMMEMDMAAPMAANQAAEAPMDTRSTAVGGLGEQKGGSFSETNVQVKGVDEADIVKTDGKYIYYINKQKLSIVDAYPGENMTVISEVSLKGDINPQEALLNGDQLIILGNEEYRYEPYIEEPGIWEEGAAPREESLVASMIMPPYMGEKAKSKVLVYDISDVNNVEKVKDWSFDGTYQTVRRIGDALYVVLNNNFWGYWGAPVPMPLDILPTYREDGKERALVGCGDVRYIPGHYLQQWTALVGLRLDDLDKDPSREVIMGGSSSTVYSSLDNMYIATPHVDTTRYTDWDWNVDRSKTVLFKFDLDDGEVSFTKKGRVPGNLLNQFSLDEHQNHLRVATTTRGNPMANHVYILDANMEIVGEITDIAPGEQIYSTRFMGNRLYMVTFQTIDPLFVIDLTNPKSPTILGKLKIPGYSDYLHPFDENHLIGFGKDATASKDGSFAWYQGMKLALFDVSDVNNPTQKQMIIIGDRGTESEVLRNHKALMWDPERKLIGFPISLSYIAEEEKVQNADVRRMAYGQTEFVGAHVYEVSPENGFILKANPTHYDEQTTLKMGQYWPYDYEKNIQRILYIDDTLYTLSPSMVKASDLTSGSDIKSVDFK